VPLINQFLKEGHEVIIGADKHPLAFLKQEFPDLQTVVIPGYEVSYDEKGSFFKLFTESVRFNKYIKIEHGLIDKIIEDYTIDMIVSDNRYGLYNDKVESIIITHQLYPKAPIGESVAHKKIAQLLNNFNAIWIPDYEGENNLSGDLAHLKPFQQKHKFIGPLSRFSSFDSAQEAIIEHEIIAILSGPEPQRTIFEELVMEQIKKHKLKAVVVRGLPNCPLRLRSGGNLIDPRESGEIPVQARNDGNIKIFNHLSTKELQEYIQKSKVVVCRAGYSSIMDLTVLGKKAILVPTPGQTEQEYLANYHFEQGNFHTQTQANFLLEKH